MIKSRYSVFFFFILLTAQFVHAGDTDTKVTKVYEKTFDFSMEGDFELINKYGEININTWDRNQAKVTITIEAFGKDASEANQQIKRVEFDFRATEDYISIVTVIDRHSGFFKEMLNNISDYSNNIMSRSKLKVDYQVYLPAYSVLKLHNKFGDVVLDRLNSRVDIDMAHGNLKSEGLMDFAKINFGFGTAQFKYVQDLNLEMKGGKLFIDEAVKLDINSSSSDISITNVNDIDLKSTNDQYRITETNKLSGAANFTDFDIGFTHNYVKLNQIYGSLRLNTLSPSFTDVHLTGKSTDYFITLPEFSDIQVDLTTNEKKLRLPNYRGELVKTYIEERNGLVNYKGYIGGMSPQNRRLKIDNSNGDVILNLAFGHGMENSKKD